MSKKIYLAGFDGRYSVDELGNVYSERRGLLKGSASTKGYIQHMLYTDPPPNRKYVMRSAHSLVMEVFGPEKPKGCDTINHKNKVIIDNRLENLEWMSNADNIEHGQALRHRLVHKDGHVIITDNINKFASSIGKTSSGNFFKLKFGKIKTCYGYILMEEM